MGADAVCWDWNGTLLDDVDRCLDAMNQVLASYEQSPIADVAAYRASFRFPIKEFYASTGIAEHSFPSAADLYLSILKRDEMSPTLHTGARDTIAALRKRHVRQVLASATLSGLLEAQLRPHGIREHFEDVLSITDPYSASKHNVIEEWLQRSGIDPSRVLMVGDTNHDHEIASSLGVQFVHFSGGHQGASTRSPNRIDALPELLDWI